LSRQWLTAIPRVMLSTALAAGLLLFIPAAGHAQPPNTQPKSTSRPQPNVHKPAPELTANWWQAVLALPASQFGRCDLGGKGNVVFLVGTTGGEVKRECTVPTGSSFLVPLINVECSKVEGNGNNLAELQECASEIANDFTNLSLVIDGKPVEGLTDLRVQSGLFTFKSVADNVFGVPATDSTIAAADGYWALIRPLPPGTHTISFGGSYPPGGFSTLATYTIIVQPGRA
jgi:hypothetical protein